MAPRDVTTCTHVSTVKMSSTGSLHNKLQVNMLAALVKAQSVQVCSAVCAIEEVHHGGGGGPGGTCW
jgi:hypothetical protein